MLVLPISARECGSTRQNNPDLSVLAGLAVDFNEPGMLLDNDIVTNGEAEAGTLARRLGGEEGIEHLFAHLKWDTGSVVPNPDLHSVTQTSRCGSQRRLKAAIFRLAFAFGRGIEPVCNQVEQELG